MPDYRRYRVSGDTYLFTINLLERRSIRKMEALHEAVRRTRAERPFHIEGWVVLPDHLHYVLTLPSSDDDFSNRIKAIKIRFVRAVAPNERRSSVRAARGERGIWQRRSWEHALRDEEDYVRHMDYVHYGQTRPCCDGGAMAVFDVSSMGPGRGLPHHCMGRWVCRRCECR